MATGTSHLDHFVILRTLGKGATSKVKSVQDPATGAIYAAKILKIQGESMTARFREVMQNEIQSLSRVSHPNIINIINANESGVYVKKNGQGSFNCMYIVMELCANGELFDLLFNTGKLSEPITRYYFKQILCGLEACHNAGISHRDIKPENILFDSLFNLKLADFGFSILLMGRDGTGILHTRLGTESYMAPELHQRKPYTGESVDLFASGIILFIMLSQNPPFTKADPNDPYYKLLYTGDERFWSMHNRNKPPNFYSADFKNLIFKMLALEPSNRFTIEQVKAHPWTNGPTASAEEVSNEINMRRRRIQEAAERGLSQRRTNPGVAYNGGRYYRGDFSESEGLTLSFGIPRDDFNVKQKPSDGYQNKYSQIKTGLLPKEIMTVVSNELGLLEAECESLPNSYDIKVSLITEIGSLNFKSSIYRDSEDFYILDFTLYEGSHFELMKIFHQISEKIIQAQDSV